MDAALRDAIDDGTVIGPRMAVAGAYVTVTSGGGELIGAAQDVTIPADYRFGVANSADEVRERVRAILNGGADFIKMIATGAVLTQGTKPGVSEYTEEQIRAAVEQAAEYGTYVTAHAHGAEGIKRAVRAGVRSIEHGSLIDDEGDRADEGARAPGWWPTSTTATTSPASAGSRAGRRRSCGRTTRPPRPSAPGSARRSPPGCGSRTAPTAGSIRTGSNARQLPYMVRYGMTPMQAIRSATLSAAELMRLGGPGRARSPPGSTPTSSPSPGDALADLKSFEKVGFVMKGGVVYKAP